MPINQVPYELLVQIFEDVTSTSGDQGNLVESVYTLENVTDGDSYLQARAVITMSHVCRHWRQTTLETAALWTRIDGRSPERLDVFLERSRTLPLSVLLSADAEELATLLSKVPVDRLYRLDLAAIVAPPKDAADFLTTLVVPNLRCLTLSLDAGCMTYGRGATAWAHILAGHADSLRALALRDIDWTPSTPFPSLTHLHLVFDSSPSTDDLLTLLANAPCLEFVTICHQSEHRPETHDFYPGVVALNRLRYIAIEDRVYRRAMNLLKHLSWPKCCFVRLTNVTWVDPYLDTLPGEPGPYADVPFLPSQHASVLRIASEEEMAFFRLIIYSDTSGAWLEGNLDGCDDDTWNAWFYRLSSMCPYSTITALHINIHLCHTFWSSILRHLTGVVDLKAIVGQIDPPECPQIPPYIIPLDTLCTALLEEPVILPSLRDLYVQGLEYDDSFERMSSKLVDMVVFRARAGHRLHRFLIQPNQSFPDGFGERTVEVLENVDRFALVGPGRPLCGFRKEDGPWQLDGAEKYWRLEEDHAVYEDLPDGNSGS